MSSDKVKSFVFEWSAIIIGYTTSRGKMEAVRDQLLSCCLTRIQLNPLAILCCVSSLKRSESDSDDNSKLEIRLVTFSS
eukprot:751161-Hanusia_phi.AAC.1